MIGLWLTDTCTCCCMFVCVLRIYLPNKEVYVGNTFFFFGIFIESFNLSERKLMAICVVCISGIIVLIASAKYSKMRIIPNAQINERFRDSIRIVWDYFYFLFQPDYRFHWTEYIDVQCIKHIMWDRYECVA